MSNDDFHLISFTEGQLVQYLGKSLRAPFFCPSMGYIKEIDGDMATVNFCGFHHRVMVEDLEPAYSLEESLEICLMGGML